MLTCSTGAKAGEVGDTFGMTNGADTSFDNSKNLNGEDIFVVVIVVKVMGIKLLVCNKEKKGIY